MTTERKEALLRIPIGIVAWIILELWGALTCFVAVINFFYTLFSGKRHKGMAKFTNNYIAFVYVSIRYLTFTTNKRPFPFRDFEKPLEKVDMKKKAK